MKKIFIVLVVIAIIGIALYFLVYLPRKNAALNQNQVVPTGTVEKQEAKPVQETSTQEQENKTETITGKSVQGLDIKAYHYGSGEKEILFVGGIHGGYSWNTVLLTYQIMDYLKANPTLIPGNIKVTVIPVLNPDGLKKVVGAAGRFSQSDVSVSQEVKVSGRFNANKVDINRNFDCEWKAIGVWQSTNVSGGSKPFSEPESAAIRDYVQKHKPIAVISWDSAAGGVFSSNCNNDEILPETQAIANIYAEASGYPAYEDFTFYELSGDMINWFAKNKIPAISVLLSTHEGIEWSKNLAGIKATLEHYAK
ncbi:MAG: M14 family metallopeptidase [Candidatus Nealsonbacteria bacterium]|nr:M14 family metallopeptidase [Candidatus Nealsonbacteria bacterium]